MTRVRLVVVDDHSLFRAGLVSLLREMDEFEVVGEAANGKEALQVVQNAHPQIVLMDVNMPVMGGIEAVEALLQQYPDLRIVMLTISKQSEDLFGAIQAGAQGYLLKNAEPEELRSALLKVAEGQAILAPDVTRQVLSAVANYSDRSEVAGLSKRELEVLGCLAQGKTTLQIAADLFVSENTVKTHVRHILDKLEASNRAEAVSKANQLGLIRSKP